MKTYDIYFNDEKNPTWRLPFLWLALGFAGLSCFTKHRESSYKIYIGKPGSPNSPVASGGISAK